MDSDVIAGAVDIFHVLDVMNVAGQVPCCIDRNVWIVSVYFHTKMGGCICHKLADGTKADDTEFLSADLTAGKFLFLFFCCLCDVAVFFVALHPFDTACDITGCQQHTGKYKLFDTICIGSRCIEDHDTLLCAVGKRNVVDAGSCSCYSEEALRQLHAVHGCTSDENRIGSLQTLGLLIVFIKVCKAYACNRI